MMLSVVGHMILPTYPMIQHKDLLQKASKSDSKALDKVQVSLLHSKTDNIRASVKPIHLLTSWSERIALPRYVKLFVKYHCPKHISTEWRLLAATALRAL